MPGAKSRPPGYAARGTAGSCEHVRVPLSQAVAEDTTSALHAGKEHEDEASNMADTKVIKKK